jgi:transcriptional regulator with XRE-family HTH domain
MTLPDLTDIDTRIGHAIRAARLQTGTKQEDLALMLGLDRTTLSRYEAGSRSAPISVLIQIAYALRIPLSKLVPGMRALETAWSEEVAPADLREITEALRKRPDLIPQVRELIALLTEHTPTIAESE